MMTRSLRVPVREELFDRFYPPVELPTGTWKSPIFLTIGRDPSNTVILSDPCISPPATLGIERKVEHLPHS